MAVERLIEVDSSTVTALVYPPAQPGPTLVLAHGAGASQRHPFLVAWAEALASRGVEVVTFNFLYTEQKRKSPDRAPVLQATYRAVVAAVRSWGRLHMCIGGKSMGGRIASMIAPAEPDVRALVFLGYPLHPPKQPDKLRVAHLPEVKRPMLFVQGTRDPFGSPDELAPHLRALRPEPEVLAVQGGDHSLTVPKKSALTQAEVNERLFDAVAEWVRRPAGSSLA